jgi:hypothetical protein
MNFTVPTNPDRKFGVWGTRRFAVRTEFYAAARVREWKGTASAVPQKLETN